MALTRAQLLAGNQSQGVVLSGQPQGVTAGSGIIISPSGSISIDPSSITGVMALNNAAAYNSYVWPPSIPAVSGSILSVDVSGNLSWATIGTGVSSVSAGDGLTGGGVGDVTLNVGAGPGIVVNANNIALSDTGVSAGTYQTANITVDAQGRILAASTGAATGGVTSISAGAGITMTPSPITSTGVISNDGVLSLTAGRGIQLSDTTGNPTISWDDTIAEVFASQTFFAGITTSVTTDGSWSSLNQGSWSFQVPDGPNYAILVYSGAVTYECYGGLNMAGAGNLTPCQTVNNEIFCQLNGGMQFIGGQSGTLTNISFGFISPLVPGKEIYRNSRMSLITLPGTGSRNFTINFYANGSAGYSAGSTSTGLGVGGVQAFIQPFQA